LEKSLFFEEEEEEMKASFCEIQTIGNSFESFFD